MEALFIKDNRNYIQYAFCILKMTVLSANLPYKRNIHTRERKSIYLISAY